MSVNWCEIGDLHLNEHDSLGVYDSSLGMNSRLAYKIDTLKHIANFLIVKHSNLDFVVFKGDIYNSINPSDLLRSLFNSVVKIFLESNIRVVIIPGNHETTGRLTAFEADQLLLEGASVNSYIAQGEASTMKIKDKTFVLVPWGKDEHLLNIPTKDKKEMALFGHFTVEGADFGHHKAKKKGSMVPLKELRKFKYVSLGHIHKPQEFYIGSAFRNGFGERKNMAFYRICEWDREVKWKDKVCDGVKMVQFIVGKNDELPAVPTDSIVQIIFQGEREWLQTLNLNKIRRELLAENTTLFKLVLRKDVVEVPKNVEIKSNENKVMDFSDILTHLTGNKKLIAYVNEKMEEVK